MLKGFGQLANLGAFVKQAQQMGGKLQSINDGLKTRRATGSGGAGLVEVEVNGLGEVLAVRIDASLIKDGDREMIEDLLPMAFNQASARAKELHADAMKSLTESLDLPGLDDLMEKISGVEP
ncbi:MAG: hypothetical protein BMS9Abin04_316 [Planctomycetia bacterium]|nr:MAG: hypothetical protein BMS9Abin04_316 [Planctomycetia bacterium]